MELGRGKLGKYIGLSYNLRRAAGVDIRMRVFLLCDNGVDVVVCKSEVTVRKNEWTVKLLYTI